MLGGANHLYLMGWADERRIYMPLVLSLKKPVWLDVTGFFPRTRGFDPAREAPFSLYTPAPRDPPVGGDARYRRDN